MLGKRLINTGGVACTTDTVQILDAGSTESLALYRFEDNADSDVTLGKFGGAAKFESSNSYLTIPSWGQSQSSDADYSLSFWLKFDSLPTTGSGYFSIIENTSGAAPIQLYIYGVSGGGHTISLQRFLGGVYYYNSGYNSTAAKYNNFQTGQWYHIAISYVASGKNVSVYVNGTQSGSTYSLGTAAGSYAAGSTDVTVKNQGGLMDQFRVFNKAISSSEVTTLFQETLSTVNTLQVLGDTSCIATYTFDGNSNDLSTNYNATSVTNVIYDYSGTESNITYTTGKFGKAASFNPSNTSHINIDNLDFPTNNFTVSVWVYLNSVSSSSGYDMILTTAKQNSGGYFYFTFSHNILYYYETGAGGAVQSSTTVSPNQWYHCVLTKSDSYGVKLYLNNVVVGSNSGFTSNNTPNTTSGGVNTIGWYNTGSSTTASFDGLMDQFRIFDRALNTSEINSLYNETATTAASSTIDTPSTIAYYKMADATDETGSYNGTATNVNFNVEGKYGFAGFFNGSNSKIVIPSDFELTGDDLPLTFSAWINFDSLIANGSFRALVGSQTSARGPIAINMYGTSSGAITASLERYESGGQYYNTGYNSTAALFTYVPNTWYHIVFSYSTGRDVSVYINGSQSGITNPTYNLDYGVSQASQNETTIGLYGSSGYGWIGKIDQVRIFNKAISADEVTKLYNEIQCANAITTPESYFNTKIYNGTGSSQNITGVGFQPDLVWIKNRANGVSNSYHTLTDSVRGGGKRIFSNVTNAEAADNYDVLSFQNDGFTIGTGTYVSYSGGSYVAWNWKAAASNTTNNDGTIQSTVRASQESGFSIVTYSGSGTNSTVGHGLSSAPKLIIVKRTDNTGNWIMYSEPTGVDKYLYLNTSGGQNSQSGTWGSSITSTTFGLYSGFSDHNNASGTYVAYCFADVDGYQRIGSYIGNGSANGPFVYTGFEPAWLLIKQISSSGNNWVLYDNKRDTENSRFKYLSPNNSDADGSDDASNYPIVDFLSNGFQIAGTDGRANTNGSSYLFWAIAANPDTTAPTKANSFKTVLYTGNSTSGTGITGVGFKPDLTWIKTRTNAFYHFWHDSVRLVQSDYYLASSDTLAQGTGAEANQRISSFDVDGFTISGTGNLSNTNKSSNDYVSWNWKALDHDRNLATINNNGSITSVVSANPEAGFSIVKYTGNGGSTAKTIGHGLSSTPEIIINKDLNSNSYDWAVYTSATGNTKKLALNQSNAPATSGVWNDTSPTNSVFSVRYDQTNATGNDFIAYCWHSCAGYSKIGTYTGNTSSTNTINVGFAPSFLMIKRTDSSGNWRIYDRERDSGNLPQRIDYNLAANSNGAEYDATSGTTGYAWFSSTGFYFDTNQTNVDINANNGTYIYMAFK